MFIYLFVIIITTVYLIQKKKVEYVCMRVCEREKKVAEILCDNSE